MSSKKDCVFRKNVLILQNRSGVVNLNQMNIKQFFFLFLFMSSVQVFSQAYKKGDKVEIEYSGTWYPGSILEVKDTQHKIHYDAYDSSWDEWVPTTRLRTVTANQMPENTKKAEETKPIVQPTTKEVQVKQEPKSNSSPSNASAQKSYFSFSKDGPPVKKYECGVSPNELWAHVYVPEEAFKYDIIYVLIAVRGDGTKTVMGTSDTNYTLMKYWELDCAAQFEALKNNGSIKHIQILDPNSKKYFYKTSFKDAFIYVEESERAKKGQLTYEGDAKTDLKSMCLPFIKNSNCYFNVGITVQNKIGERQEWVYKYSDHSDGEGRWETKIIYSAEKFIIEYDVHEELFIDAKSPNNKVKY